VLFLTQLTVITLCVIGAVWHCGNDVSGRQADATAESFLRHAGPRA